MLEKPNIADKGIITCLGKNYGLRVKTLTFLPLGADVNTAVYQAVTVEGISYFVKLRRGPFSPASIIVPKFLSEQGLDQIIPPLPTQTGEYWAGLDPFKVIVYPFIAGQNGFEVNLSDHQRITFGAALKKLHTTSFPPALTDTVRRETFSARWRDAVATYLTHIEQKRFTDPVSVQLAAFLSAKRHEIIALVQRAERLAATLRKQNPAFILCHGDIHAWNLLLNGRGNLYLVDWDTLVFAPKERDLMFVGCGLGGYGHTLQEEERLFYQGYGPTTVNPFALAYYRYERIVEDVAVFCEEIFASLVGEKDREQALVYLKSNFRPNGTIALAYQTDKTTGEHIPG